MGKYVMLLQGLFAEIFEECYSKIIKNTVLKQLVNKPCAEIVYFRRKYFHVLFNGFYT